MKRLASKPCSLRFKRVAWIGQLGERWSSLHWCNKGYYTITSSHRLRNGRKLVHQTKRASRTDFDAEVSKVWHHYGHFYP